MEVLRGQQHRLPSGREREERLVTQNGVTPPKNTPRQIFLTSIGSTQRLQHSCPRSDAARDKITPPPGTDILVALATRTFLSPLCNSASRNHPMVFAGGLDGAREGSRFGASPCSSCEAAPWDLPPAAWPACVRWTPSPASPSSCSASASFLPSPGPWHRTPAPSSPASAEAHCALKQHHETTFGWQTLPFGKWQRMATNPHAALRRSCAVKKRECVPVLVSAAAGNKSATRPPLPPPRCGGEWKETGRNWRVGIGQFNRTANRGNSNNNGTDKEKIRHKLA